MSRTKRHQKRQLRSARGPRSPSPVQSDDDVEPRQAKRPRKEIASVPEPGGMSRVGGRRIPDLETIPRGLLSCEIFPSKIIYSFSWQEDRGPSHRSSESDEGTSTDKGDECYEVYTETIPKQASTCAIGKDKNCSLPRRIICWWIKETRPYDMGSNCEPLFRKNEGLPSGSI